MELKRTRYSTWRLQKLYDTGKYNCSHRRYSAREWEDFYPSLKDLPIGYNYLEVKLIRKEAKCQKN